MTDGRERFALERRPNGAVIIEEGRIGVSDLAVFYSADHQLALAVVHFVNGDIAEAEQLRIEWLVRRKRAAGRERLVEKPEPARIRSQARRNEQCAISPKPSLPWSVAARTPSTSRSAQPEHPATTPHSAKPSLSPHPADFLEVSHSLRGQAKHPHPPALPSVSPTRE
jgi:hypothetical protein